MRTDSRIEVVINDRIKITAFPTGRKENRGVISIEVENDCTFSSADISPGEARSMARSLIDVADKAERFSTRGFVGSDE